MASNYIQTGDILTLIAPQGGVKSGVAKYIGNRLVIPITDAEENQKFAAAVTNVWSIKKADPTEIFRQLVTAYWQEKTQDVAEGVTSVKSYKSGADTIDNIVIGHFTKASSEEDDFAEVRLHG